ncbi:hypothetical protein MSG28_002156 [Choristoneura fumiferana]|uniref:Uncharacterized protein n=1 Tax=Choristoneura fumiferana TaxID=7141 RepID=A0ACC0JUZ2_CHOFU|nr:hypothetical protein MSG28_002156 [Choristoneura fumiferana]
MLNGFKMFRRSFSQYRCLRSQSKNPFKRTWGILAEEFPIMLGLNKKPQHYPEHADVVIIGGGFIGSSVAYWLKTKASHGLSVVVIEKDLTYAAVQKNITLGSLTQHFSLPENIYLSQHSAEFLRNSKEYLGPNVDLKYTPSGHLLLACEEHAEKLEQNVGIQREFGIRNELLSPKEIKSKFPWINTEDIKLGCVGYESEGSFDSWALLRGLVQKSIDMGTTYIQADVTGFELEQQRDVLMEGVKPGSFQRINKVLYRTPDNEEYAIKFAACILAAGHESSQVAQLAKIGNGEGLLTIPLPIEKRECNVYSIENSAKSTGLNTPLMMDTSGVWLKKGGLGSDLLCGAIPVLSPSATGLTAEDHVEQIIKPSLVNRIPQFQKAKVTSIASETNDYCHYDDSGILGPHSYHNNLYIAAGFGKQGCQHASGIGRAIAELIIDGQYTQPRIDPIQLLNCLSVLLSPNGGIKSRDEVQRLANLMTKFSKKLVSKCIYIQILKCTETELLGLFMGSGGWRLVHMWLTESIVAKNWPLVRELLELLLLCPVDIEHLKTNNCPKLVKELSKDGNQFAIRALASKLVEQWLKTVKGEHVVPVQSTDIPQIIIDAQKEITSESSVKHEVPDFENVDQSFNEHDTKSDLIQPEISSDHLIQKEDCNGIEDEPKEELDKEPDTLPVLKITLKDGKQILSQVDETDNKVSDKSKDKHKSKSKEKSHDNSSSKSSSSKHSSKSLSSNDKHKSSKSDSSHRHSSKESSRDKSKHSSHSSKSKSDSSRRSSSDKSSSSSNKSKEDRSNKSSSDKSRSKDKIKDEKKKETSETSAEKSGPPSIHKLGKIPKLSDVKKEKPSISIEVRKPDEPKPKTVKTFNSKFRKHGLEEEVKPPPSRASLLNKKPLPTLPPTVSIPKRPSPVHNEPPPEKKPKVEPVEKPGAIKLIPPKPKRCQSCQSKISSSVYNYLSNYINSAMLLLESDMFMDALNASATNKKEPKKRKRRTSGSKDGNTTNDGSPPHTPNSISSPTSESKSVPPKFYQDTLDTEEEKEKTNDRLSDSNENKENSSDKELDESIDMSEPPPHTLTINGLKGVLCYHKRKGPKKSIKWKPDSELEEIQYFDLDETERVNVTKTFTDMKHLERIHEREAFQKGRNLSGDDLMEERTSWKPLIPIDTEGQVQVEYGKNSKEKDIQAIRQKGTLQPLYFHKSMIPDSALEPDTETHTYSEPTIIPLEDVTGNQDNTSDFRNMPWPEPKGNTPPASSNNINMPAMFPTNMPQFPNGFPPAQFPNVPGFQGPPGMVPADWQNGVPPHIMANGIPGGIPPAGLTPGAIPPVNMPPGMMVPPDNMMMGPEMFVGGPNAMFPPGMGPDGFSMQPNMFPPDFNMSGPPGNGPEGFPGPGNFRGPMRGRGSGGHWRGKGSGSWDGPQRGRGGNGNARGGRKADTLDTEEEKEKTNDRLSDSNENKENSSDKELDESIDIRYLLTIVSRNMQRWFFAEDRSRPKSRVPKKMSFKAPEPEPELTYQDWTFTVSVPDVNARETVVIVGSIYELGEWDYTKAVPLENHPGTDLWSKTLTIPNTCEIYYRYAICAISDENKDDIVVRYWETNIKPRVIPETMLHPVTDIFGKYNDRVGVTRGWLTSQTLLQFKFVKNPLKLKTRLTGRVMSIKVTPVSLCFGAEGQIEDSVSTDTTEVEAPAGVSVEASTLDDNASVCHLHVQEQFGKEYKPNDILIINVMASQPRSLAYLIDFYCYSSRASMEDPPCHVGYTYVLPNMFKPSEGTLELPVTCNIKHRPLGTVTFHYLIIHPLPEKLCNFEVSYAKYWDPAWTGLEVGHRGLGASFKTKEGNSIRENTIASLKKAAASGADMLEFDVQLSKDMIPVIYHDFYVCISMKRKKEIDFTEMLELPVKDLTLEHLQKLKVYHLVEGRNHETLFNDEDLEEHQPFPTLEMAFKEIDIHVGFNVELKWTMELEDGTFELNNPFDMNTYVDKVLEVVLKNGGDRRIIFSCFNPDICTMVRYKQNKYPVMFLTVGKTEKYQPYRDPRCLSIPAAVQNAISSDILGIVVHTEDLLRDPSQVNFLCS